MICIDGGGEGIFEDVHLDIAGGGQGAGQAHRNGGRSASFTDSGIVGGKRNCAAKITILYIEQNRAIESVTCCGSSQGKFFNRLNNGVCIDVQGKRAAGASCGDSDSGGNASCKICCVNGGGWNALGLLY